MTTTTTAIPAAMAANIWSDLGDFDPDELLLRFREVVRDSGCLVCNVTETRMPRGSCSIVVTLAEGHAVMHVWRTREDAIGIGGVALFSFVMTSGRATVGRALAALRSRFPGLRPDSLSLTKVAHAVDQGPANEEQAEPVVVVKGRSVGATSMYTDELEKPTTKGRGGKASKVGRVTRKGSSGG